MDEIESSGSAGASNRLKSYKYKGRDVQEMRRGREEEGFQLRKQKKELLVCVQVFVDCNFLKSSYCILYDYVCISSI